jgi:hypothetical protein
MNENDEARDAFGGGSSDASSAFGESARPSQPTPRPAALSPRPPAPPSAPQPPSQAFADAGQRQASLTPTPSAIPPDAIIALLLSLAGIFFCPFIASVFALRFVARARKLIASEPERYSASGIVAFAAVLAWLSIVLTTIVVLLVLVAALAGSG